MRETTCICLEHVLREGLNQLSQLWQRLVAASLSASPFLPLKRVWKELSALNFLSLIIHPSENVA